MNHQTNLNIAKYHEFHSGKLEFIRACRTTFLRIFLSMPQPSTIAELTKLKVIKNSQRIFFFSVKLSIIRPETSCPLINVLFALLSNLISQLVTILRSLNLLL